MGRILGIDLGTTNSVVAVFDKNGPTIVPNALGDRTTPSVVGFARNGEILVGRKAKRAAVMNVGRTVFSVKRLMGTSERVKVDGKEYSPQEISGMILQKLVQDAESYFGERITEVIITVPAYFTDTQRAATKDAGEIAGLNVRRIIDEPTAAALAYGLDRDKDQVLMVYDFGGGTFDVSIIEYISGVFQVLAIQGNTRLGGDDFDTRVTEWLVSEFSAQHGIDVSEDPIAMQRLREAAEEAKCELSELKETHILVEAVTMSEKGPLTLDTVLSRDKFETMVKDLILSSKEPMEKCMEASGLTGDKIDTVLLVGGTTRIPAVRALVREIINREPQRDISPDEVVALGAAVQSLVIKPLEGSDGQDLAARYGKDKPVIIHVTPFSLGVGLQQDQFSVIVDRNSTYPTEAKDIFTTSRDFQENISFPIYEGEKLTASENTFLDLLRIEGVAPAPRGVPRIEVTFQINADRILEARAEDLATGVEKVITVESTGARLTESEKLRMTREARDRVSSQLKSRMEADAVAEISGLVTRANATAKANSSHPLANQVIALAEQLKRTIDADPHADVEDVTDDLLRLMTELESAN